MEMKLTGWKAIIAIVAVAGFFVFRVSVQSEALQTDGVEEVRRWLVSESARAMLPDMQRAMENTGDNAEYLEKTVNDLQEENFEIISVIWHGFGNRIVSRVEVRHKGKPASEGTKVRYLRMNYSMAAGWRVQRETTRWNYYMAAFDG